MYKFLLSLLCACLSIGCKTQSSENKNQYLTDSASIAEGKNLFELNCSGCHSFDRDGIGPNLSGVTQTVSYEMVIDFITNPQKVVDSGDERAAELLRKYKVVMPAFAHMEKDSIDKIAAYLHTQKTKAKAEEIDSLALSNPIPDSILFSDLVMNLKPWVKIPSSSDEMPRTRIIKIEFTKNNKQAFVLDQRGKLYVVQNEKPEVYLDMSAMRSHFINKPGFATGFGNFAFHPDFNKNGLLYTTHSEAPAKARADFSYADSIKVTLQWVLTEWKTQQPHAIPFEGEGRELFRIDMVTGIHGVQEINFNPLAKKSDDDYGLLYIGIGDGGGTENGFPFLVNARDAIWGTILRIDASGKNSKNGHYGIPSSNPFAKSSSVKTNPEIYAYGFRNPHRFTWSKQGVMLGCSIGHHAIESLYIIKPGRNYGWPIREGSFLINPAGNMHYVYPLPDDDSLFHITYPVAEYDHNEGSAISLGYEYTGNKVPNLNGKLFITDIPTGKLFYINMADIQEGKKAPIYKFKIAIDGKVTNIVDLVGSKRVDARFARDRYGELYLFNKPNGMIYKVVP